MTLNRLYPIRPTGAPNFDWIGPAAVRLEDFAHADKPGCELDVYEGDGGAEEERAGGVGGGDEGGEVGG